MRKLLRVLAVLLVVLAAAWLAAVAWLSLRNPRVEFAAEELARSAAPLPDGFLWGTATASHQIEGGNTNDWSRFETQKGAIERGETSAVSAGAWDRLTDDIALMKRIRANAYRFSIEWSRLEPSDGASNEAAWERYAAFVKELRAQGITPMVTLLHFTLPQWMADLGGVAAPDFPDRFGRFASEAGKRLGPDVDLWVTLNEPFVQMYMGYVTGRWPPQVESEAATGQAFRGLLRAHAAGARALRAADTAARIGIANNVMRLEPASRLLLTDWMAASFVDQLWNWSFADSIRDGRARLWRPGAGSVDEAMPELRGTTDYFGLNYYFRYFVRLAPGNENGLEMTPGRGLVSEIGGSDPTGDSPPEALYLLVKEAFRRYGQPIYVTEGGIADEKGTMRGALIRGQRHAIDRALAEGVAVRGYLHWTLMDNFEWEKGYRPRFGLYRVDFATLERTPAGGSEVFADLAPR